MTITYSFVNQKGGVGKTTTVVSLGAYLAEMGKKVLLIDLDPQGNATACLGVESFSKGTYDVILGNASAAECILSNTRLRISLLPSSPALAGARVELIEMQAREHRVEKALEPINGRYDYILIDCPPSLGLLTVNGLVAAKDGVIIPVQCEYLALEGLSQLMTTLDHAKARLNPGMTIRGLVLTMYDSRTNLARDVVEEVRTHFPGKVFKSIIPRTVRLAEAPSHGLPISVYAPQSTGGIAYRALANELLNADQV
ncbi:MAG: ParA family protein [Chloroflexi bacterium]|nr:ParA family protein [Chloroflexota bacterium]